MTFTAFPPTDKYRVLHIDDEDEQLFFAKTFIEEADPRLEIIPVKTSEELLEFLDDTVDCVVSDYVMPGLNGMELCEKVKELSDVPYVIYTGRGSEVVAEAAFNWGVDDYVRKEPEPSHYKVLARRIRSHAENYRKDRDAAHYQKKLEGVRSTLGLISAANTMESVAVTTFAILEEILGYGEGCFTLVDGDIRDTIHAVNSDKPDLEMLEQVIESGETEEPLRCLSGCGQTFKDVQPAYVCNSCFKEFLQEESKYRHIYNFEVNVPMLEEMRQSMVNTDEMKMWEEKNKQYSENIEQTKQMQEEIRTQLRALIEHKIKKS